jgi:hypothetical protein
MKLALSALAILSVTSAGAWQNAAEAQVGPVEPPHSTSAPRSFVTMVCHESGGSGAPLTDYVNNVDLSFFSNGQLQSALPSSVPTIYTETNPGPNGLPTSCAVAASYLSQLGFTLTHSLSHFPGYYIEIFTI